MTFGTIDIGAVACCESEAKLKTCAEAAGVSSSVDCTGCTIDGNQICEYDITGSGSVGIANHDYPCTSGTCSNNAVDITSAEVGEVGQVLIQVQTCKTGGVDGTGYSMIQIIGGAAGAVIVIALCGFCWYWRQRQIPGAALSEPLLDDDYREFPETKLQAPNPPKGLSRGNARLPPGWTQDVDPNSGETYYTNPLGDSQWECPT